MKNWTMMECPVFLSPFTGGGSPVEVRSALVRLLPRISSGITSLAVSIVVYPPPDLLGSECCSDMLAWPEFKLASVTCGTAMLTVSATPCLEILIRVRRQV